jgi:hypothetical protein
MPTNDELLYAIQQLVSNHSAYRAEITDIVMAMQRRMVASEKLLVRVMEELEEERAARIAADQATSEAGRILATKKRFTDAILACVVFLFVIMVLLSFRG